MSKTSLRNLAGLIWIATAFAFFFLGLFRTSETGRMAIDTLFAAASTASLIAGVVLLMPWIKKFLGLDEPGPE